MIDRNFYLKSFQKKKKKKKFKKKISIRKKKKNLEKKMSFVKEIFDDQHSENEIINLLGKRYDINEKDDVFRWLCSYF